ncbi:MAG: signal recognition particle-docking protein FtsY [Myxococcales bacterium]|jgi:fused signal recognition particle receptor|nr:signal recognition particle-docking protein FtsY [Myxococcales bacterium]
MDTILYAVIGLVVVGALVYFFVLRKKPQPELPAGETKPASRAETPTVRPTEPKPAPEEKPTRTAPTPEPRVEQKRVLPEPLASADVIPVEESQREQPAAEPAAPAPKPKRDIAGLRKGLTATRGGFIARLAALFSGKKEIDPAILQEIEEVMLTSDVGVKTTQSILERLKERLDKNELSDGDAVWAALREEAVRILSLPSEPLSRRSGKNKPMVVLMVGVNGVGKTTTIGKLATRIIGDGRKVMLAAGDTFRAAAVQQLEVWGKRVGAEVVKGKEGADPGAVAFEATTKAKDGAMDVLLIDTAGRLHTKSPLMDEIKKVRKTIAKAMDGAPHETLLVLDATTGQNALTQAQMFKDAVDLTGIVLTKLDGTAKGGIVLGICDELKVPVKYIGLGERAEDLREFSPEDFALALFGKDDDEARAA